MSLSIGLIAGLLFSLLIGLSLGLLGGGGSMITLPILVYVIGLEPRESVPVSLVVVGATAIFSAWLHHRKAGHVSWRTAGLFTLAGIPGAIGGAWLTWLVSGRTLLLIFAGLMIVVATLMLRRGERKDIEEEEHHPVKAVLAGSIVGVLTGFLGVGGGFLIVPALMLFGGLHIKDAIGTSLVVIAVNCAAGLVGHLASGSIDWRLSLLVTLFALSGAVSGTRISLRTNPARLRKGFAVFILVLAAVIVIQNFTGPS